MLNIHARVDLVMDFPGGQDADDFVLRQIDNINEVLQRADLNYQPQLGSPQEAEIEGKED